MTGCAWYTQALAIVGAIEAVAVVMVGLYVLGVYVAEWRARP